MNERQQNFYNEMVTEAQKVVDRRTSIYFEEMKRSKKDFNSDEWKQLVECVYDLRTAFDYLTIANKDNE